MQAISRTSESRSEPLRLRAIYQLLLDMYGSQGWWPARTSFEVIVGAFLVQNTNWRGVTRSIANLEARGALTIAGLRTLPLEELRTLIRPSGYMIRKSIALKAFIAFLDDACAGSLEILAAQSTSVLRTQLLDLPGVGPETADAILLYALGHPVMVVDEYLRRIAIRHELAPQKSSYVALQQLALSAFATGAEPTLLQHFNEFHALIVEVGKNHCGPTPRCEKCPLAAMLKDQLSSLNEPRTGALTIQD
jgi:endonuclease-3 related protein